MLDSKTIEKLLYEQTSVREDTILELVKNEWVESWEDDSPNGVYMNREDTLNQLAEQTVFIEGLKKKLLDTKETEEITEWYEEKYKKNKEIA